MTRGKSWLNGQRQADELVAALEELAGWLQDAYGPVRARTLLLLGAKVLFARAEDIETGRAAGLNGEN
ncbi:MAG: hypothetical protein FWD17_17930 [Polyangiaceae bacterium]|nr:hypothetical protein [Polyangiaceae bacterium]